VNAVADALGELGGRQPNEFESAAVFGAMGISTAGSLVVEAQHSESSSLESTIAFPVVAKVLSADIPHKTDAGGVVLGIRNEADLSTAIATIRSNVAQCHPDAQVDGILVQQMVTGLAEVILGFRRDPEVGPVVVLGVGGVLAELYKDIAVRMAPVGIDDARSMVEEVKGLAVVRGYRRLPLGDCEALAKAIVSISHLASDRLDSVAEAEINPLLVLPEGAGVVAVDGLVVPAAG
jgi:succinyl-CoA synthetase beta subunit